MSILSRNNSNTGGPFFHEFKKQASFFLKEKIKTARLALTDVTPAELLTEEATNGNPWSPDTRTMGTISRAAFEVDDYFRIVGILHKRFSKFERKNWRVCYNSLILLEHLLTHGPESVAEEFQSDQNVIREMGSFQYIDEKGFNWGLAVRKKSERILKLLEKGALLKEERDRARKLTRGIQGFGSFCQRSSSTQGILQESSHRMFERSNSDYNEHECQENENQLLPSNGGGPTQNLKKSKEGNEVADHHPPGLKIDNLNSAGNFSDGKKLAKQKSQTRFKENKAPNEEELHRWNCAEEDNPLLDDKRGEQRIENEEDHPFNESENQTTASLLSATAREGILKGC